MAEGFWSRIGSWVFGRRLEEPETPQEGQEPPAIEPGRIWPYSAQFSGLVRESHRNPPTALGSPTFVWHIGIWPKHPPDGAGAAQNFESMAIERLEKAQTAFSSQQRAFYDEISDLLQRLQEAGCVGADRKGFVKRFQLDDCELYAPQGGYEGVDPKRVFRFSDVKPQAISFTMWWRDDNAWIRDAPDKKPSPHDLRIVVLAQSHFDHATITFHIDAGKPYGAPQFDKSNRKDDATLGQRRAKIARMLDDIRRVTGDQIRNGVIDMSRLPEREVSPEDAKALKDAADYFYDGVWREFMRCFKLRLEPAAVKEDDETDEIDAAAPLAESNQTEAQIGERFADIRGLVMSVRGLETAGDAERRKTAQELRKVNGANLPNTPETGAGGASTRDPYWDAPDPSTAYTGFGPFDVFDEKRSEPNAVLKAFWPFIRRSTRWADYRQLIGCGILSWRALFVSALGASDDFFPDQEAPSRDDEIPGGHLPILEKMSDPPSESHLQVLRANRRREYLRSQRYLLLTKGEPNREQIGRFVERLNALGTIRLFALKYVTDIKNAGHHLRLIGNHLDGVLSKWSRDRHQIDAQVQRMKENARGLDNKKTINNLIRSIFLSPEARWGVPRRLQAKISRYRVAALNRLISENERELIELAGEMDYIFRGGVGRFTYAVNRSRYFADEFERLFPSLEIGNVDGWMNYTQFVERGPKRSFDYIKSAGDRLVALRQRLQVVTETIQTTALVVETEATRNNTDTINSFGYIFRVVSWTTMFMISASAVLWIYNEFHFDCKGALTDFAIYLGFSTNACQERVQELKNAERWIDGRLIWIVGSILVSIAFMYYISWRRSPRRKLENSIDEKMRREVALARGGLARRRRRRPPVPASTEN